MKRRPSNRLVWFAVLGGAGAWAVQFVINLAFSFAQCNAPAGRWQLPVHGWEIVVSAVAVAIALAAEGVSLWLYLRTFNLDHIAEAERRGEGAAPPTGRINFLAMVGLTVNFLALAIIVMTGIGAPLLPVCQQS
jgi:hypothetical protein